MTETWAAEDQEASQQPLSALFISGSFWLRAGLDDQEAAQLALLGFLWLGKIELPQPAGRLISYFRPVVKQPVWPSGIAAWLKSQGPWVRAPTARTFPFWETPAEGSVGNNRRWPLDFLLKVKGKAQGKDKQQGWRGVDYCRFVYICRGGGLKGYPLKTTFVFVW